MDIDELARAAVIACDRKIKMTLVFDSGVKRPRKFPRGELLCVNSQGGKVYSFDPVKIIQWIENETRG